MIWERGKSCESKEESMALCSLSGGFDPMTLAGALTVQRKGNKDRDHGCRGRVGSMMVGTRGHPILMDSFFFMNQDYWLQVKNETEEKIWNSYLSQQETKRT